MVRGATGMQPPMTMQSTYPAAPELAITRWFNTATDPTLADLRGEVVVIEAFQMLCPVLSDLRDRICRVASLTMR